MSVLLAIPIPAQFTATVTAPYLSLATSRALLTSLSDVTCVYVCVCVCVQMCVYVSK